MSIRHLLGRLKRSALNLLPRPVAGRLRAWRVRRLIATYQPRVVERDYGGGTLRIYLADPLAAGWYDHDWPVLPEIAALRQSRLRPGSRVFDLGAHQGIVALMLAREVGPAGRVVAVEPSPHNAAVAIRNRDLNDALHLDVVQAAVADRTGTLTFNAGLNGQLDDGTGAGGRINVDAVTLDSLAERFGPPDVVFLDVEGAECLALVGGQGVLARGADFFVEVHVGCGLELLGGTVERILSYFPEDRFTLLARAEHEPDFRPLESAHSLSRDRFFLLALVRSDGVA